MAEPRYARFEPQTLSFPDELSANNNREWFKENKTRYEEQVLDVALRFIHSTHDPLHDIAPHFVAQATRISGLLMRAYRSGAGVHWGWHVAPRIESAARDSRENCSEAGRPAHAFPMQVCWCAVLANC